MRIGWVTPYLPFPENTGGRIRIANLARGFDPESDELHLFSRLSSDDGDDEVRGAREAAGPFRSVTTFAARRAGPLPTALPRFVREQPRELSLALAAAHARAPFDVVVFEHCYAFSDPPTVPAGALAVLNEHNVESTYFLRAARRARRRRLSNALDFLRWRAFERRTWGVADLITTVSAADRERVASVRPAPGPVVPNGIALDRYAYRPPSARHGNGILFVGTMSYDPNVEAARFLAAEVLPRVRQRVPGATLTIAGRDPTPAVRALAGQGVTVTGTVSDIAREFERHRVYAMPVAVGAGSSLKTLEPLAAGLPLVASPFAARGFHFCPGTHYLPAEGPARFADALVNVLIDPAAYDDLAAAAHDAVRAYDWPTLAASFVGAVRRAREGRPVAPAEP